MRKAAKVLTILGMCLAFYLIFPVVLGIIGLQKMEGDYSRKEKRLWGLLVTFFVSTLGGIFMLCVYDETEEEQNARQGSVSDKKSIRSLDRKSKRIRQLKYFCDKGVISESFLNEKKEEYYLKRVFHGSKKINRKEIIRLALSIVLLVFASISFVMTFAYCFVETSYRDYIVPIYTEHTFWQDQWISSPAGILIVVSFGLSVLQLVFQLFLIFRFKSVCREVSLIPILFQTAIIATLISAICFIVQATDESRIRHCELLPGGVFALTMVIITIVFAVVSAAACVYDSTKTKSFVVSLLKRRESYKKISNLIVLMNEGVLSQEEVSRFSCQYIDNL